MTSRKTVVFIHFLAVFLCLLAIVWFSDSIAVVAAVVLLSAVAVGSCWTLWRRTGKDLEQIEKALRSLPEGETLEHRLALSEEARGRVGRALEETARTVRDHVHRLESERDHLVTVINSMSEGVLVTDGRGRVIETNPAFHDIFELERDPIGRFPLEVIRNAQVQEGIEAVLLGKLHHQSKLKITEKVLLARFAPIASERGLAGVVVVFHDITELERLETLRKEFISNVSHELKTPLTSIRGYAETLLNDENPRGMQHNFLQKIYRNAEQLSQMLEELFRLASLESRRDPLERDEIWFSRLMKELEIEFEEKLKAKNVKLIVQNQTGSEVFLAGETYIRRVLYNLIDNALEYSNTSEIQVQMDSQDSGLTFSVKDFGIGIPEADLSRIFERFYRVHKDRSRRTGGAGIGLALVKHIVQIHGGGVWAKSEPGKGTTISFTLPDARPESLPATED